MCRFWLVLVLLLCAIPAHAQSTSVSGTITDQGGQAWFAGTIQFRFRPADSNPTSQYFWNGVPFDKSTTLPANPLTLNGSGAFSALSVPSNTSIAPGGSTWTVTVCPAASVPNCYSQNLTITGATQNISSQLIPPAAMVNLTVPLLAARAYTDASIIGASPGVQYFNVTDNKTHVCIQSGFPPCTWTATSGIGSSPGGANTNVQFNNSAAFGGDLRFTFNSATGAMVETGTAFIGTLNNIVTVDGVKYTTATGALADPVCSGTAGCTIDMRGNNSGAALALGAFDPGSSKVTLLLGPYAYSTSGIKIESYFGIYGAARGSTTIQSTSTTAPIFTLGGSTAVYSFHLEHAIIYCGAGNSSQVAFNIVAQVNGGGLNNSDFKDVSIGGDGTHECGGESILLDGSNGGSPPAINQFLNFTNVQAFRKSGGAPAFHVRGVGGQMFIANSQFDGNATRDTLPDVVIEDSAYSGFTAAYSIAFYETTMQRAGTAIKLRGSTDVSCDNCHFEDVTGIIDAAVGQHYGNFGTQILHSYCATNCAVASGATGYLTKTDANSQVAVDYLSLFGTPDNYWTGSSIINLEHKGLFNFSSGTTYPAPNSSQRIPVGIDCDSPGYKCATAAVTGITAGAYAEVDITWTTPFVDASYVPVCVVYDGTSGTTSAGLRFLIGSRVAARFSRPRG